MFRSTKTFRSTEKDFGRDQRDRVNKGVLTNSLGCTAQVPARSLAIIF
jgi:hypothetical protein